MILLLNVSQHLEAVNSFIRRYLATYKSILNWFCPLFSFYWNHRRCQRGKRAGLKPAEVLTGQMIERDWVEEILDHYPFKKQSLAS